MKRTEMKNNCDAQRYGLLQSTQARGLAVVTGQEYNLDMNKGYCSKGPNVRQNFDVSDDVIRCVIELHAASAPVAMSVNLGRDHGWIVPYLDPPGQSVWFTWKIHGAFTLAAACQHIELGEQ